MGINIITAILLAAFFYPIIMGFIVRFSSKSLKREIQDLNSNINFVLSIILSIYLERKIFIEHNINPYKRIYELIPAKVVSNLNDNPIFIYVVVIPLMIFIIYEIAFFIFENLCKITIYIIVDTIESAIAKRSDMARRVIGAIIQIPRSFCYVIILCFIFNLFSMMNLKTDIDKKLQGSGLYNYVCRNVIIPAAKSKLARQLPNILNNSFRVIVKEVDSGNTANSDGKNRKVVVYYNGVTLDEGIKSNDAIDNFSRQLVSNESDSKSKARTIYNWVGSNIDYDEDKAVKVLNNDYNVHSGAIEAYNTKKGICFDYACLYTAMCRADGLKVRIITGEGFNGVSWVSHAWNQVYVSEENMWINVDTTFYKGGNYFNSVRFNRDHRDAKVVGEW